MNDLQKTHRIKIRPKSAVLSRLLEQRKAAASVGGKMPDGTVFAGYTQGGQKLFAMPKDAQLGMNFNAAAAYVTQQNNIKALGHDDWRLPTKEELALLCRNKDKGALRATFTHSWRREGGTDGGYWSSTPATPLGSIHTMYVQYPADGSLSQSSMGCRAAVRCVR